MVSILNLFNHGYHYQFQSREIIFGFLIYQHLYFGSHSADIFLLKDRVENNFSFDYIYNLIIISAIFG